MSLLTRILTVAVLIPIVGPEDQNHWTVCFDHLGCLQSSEFWYDWTYRPFNLKPLGRHTIRTEFLLLKCFNYTSHEILYDILTLRKETIAISSFTKGLKTIFLIHDFTSNGQTGWIKHMAMALIRLQKYNVISVDWEAGAEPPFKQAASNARVVALEIITFIKHVKLFEEDVHLIGHGLGAHIAAYVGKEIRGIGRITGLDPTGYGFQHMPTFVKLSKTDALYVEVLHTDAYHAYSEGTWETMGHADFYINNAALQPGCDDKTNLPAFYNVRRDDLTEGAILPGCSHKRAFKYYIESIENKECSFLGIKCESMQKLRAGQCDKRIGKSPHVANFGLNSRVNSVKGNNTFFVLTGTESPYCFHVYLVTLRLAKSSPKGKGKFEMVVIGDCNTLVNMTTMDSWDEKRVMRPGKSYEILFYAESPKVSTVKEAKVLWSRYGGDRRFLAGPYTIHVQSITLKHVEPDMEENAPETQLCPVAACQMPSGSYVRFTKCCAGCKVKRMKGSMAKGDEGIMHRKTIGK